MRSLGLGAQEAPGSAANIGYHPSPGIQKVASGASAASGQTQISWTNFDQNHVYFVQALHRNCGKMYLTQTKGVLDSIFST